MIRVALAGFVAGAALMAAVAGVGILALAGLIVWALVATATVLYLLGFTPADFR